MANRFRWGDIDHLIETTGLSELAATSVDEGGGATLSRIRLHADDGAGEIEYFCDEAMRVLIFDCAFREARTFEVYDGDWIRLNFSLNLNIDMAFGPSFNVQEWTPSWRVIRVPQGQLIVEAVPAGARLQWVTVCCKADRLARLAGIGLDDLPFRLTGEAPSEDDVIYRPFPLVGALKSLTANMIGGLRPRGGLARAYVARKADELLILALDQLLNDYSIESLQVRLSDRDIQALHTARQILDDTLASPPTVANLCQRVGINRNKLYYGFKSLFRVSVSEYVQQCKIELGHRLVTTSDLPISDIAAAVGFRHQCNFSTAFKARYGASPIVLRQQHRVGIAPADPVAARA
ncbi:MAG: AraC family transcriptional regulator [Caulobacteraceae bacterium]|nr:AraC family transcriptional regulator [Caulobacteraceae bacterium]